MNTQPKFIPTVMDALNFEKSRVGLSKSDQPFTKCNEEGTNTRFVIAYTLIKRVDNFEEETNENFLCWKLVYGPTAQQDNNNTFTLLYLSLILTDYPSIFGLFYKARKNFFFTKYRTEFYANYL